MGYDIQTVCNRRTLRDFIRLPRFIYHSDPNWVPPLSSEVQRTLDERRNPYFANASLKLFVCYKNNVPVARTAIVVNRQHQEKFGINAAFFGFFESINDMEAVRRLFGSVEYYCRSQNVEILEGPFNPNHYSELGLLTNKFDTPPAFFQPYNPAYYCDLLESIGFRKAVCFYTAKNERIREYVQHRYGDEDRPLEIDGYIVRSIDAANFEKDLERIRGVFNDSFSSNWHFLPVTKEEYQFTSKYLRLVTNPELVTIVEHQGSPVAVLMCVLDINPLLKRLNGRIGPIKYLRFLQARKSIRSLLIYAVGIRSSYQRTRVFCLLVNAMARIARNYDTLETTWMLEKNLPAIRAAELFGMKPDKYFAIYEKRLSSSAKMNKRERANA